MNFLSPVSLSLECHAQFRLTPSAVVWSTRLSESATIHHRTEQNGTDQRKKREGSKEGRKPLRLLIELRLDDDDENGKRGSERDERGGGEESSRTMNSR